jgi:SHS2 domain-containing protein
VRRLFNAAMTSAYSYFEHDADIGVTGRGETLEAALEAAAAGVFAVMTDLEKVRATDTIRLEFDEGDPELALVVWLNLLLGRAREHRMVFAGFHLRQEGSRWYGEAAGECWREGLTRGTEVKGATFTMLRCEQRSGHWEARCVVDV